MPLGNGEVGINLWTEGCRDLCLYTTRTDAWDADGRLCKIGRIRLRFPVDTFTEDAPFQQVLDLASATVRISSLGLGVTCWVDAHAPMVHIGIESREPLPLTVVAELWRSERTISEPGEMFAFMRQAAPWEAAQESPDEVLDAGGEAIAWCHHNRRSCWTANLRHQFLGDWAAEHAGDDPLLGRTFGCLVSGEGLHRTGRLELAGDGRRRWDVAIGTACAKTSAPDRLLPFLRLGLVSGAEARNAHLSWWRDFWDRSWIKVTGDAAAEAVTLGYALQRFLFACSGRGAYPIKFNGSLFTVSGRDQGRTFSPDWRRWGGAYWFQNTRLAYWPMVMSGDADLAAPLFRMYQAALPLSRARTSVHHGLPGVVMPETITPWGTWTSEDYGYAEVRAEVLAGRPARPDYHAFSGPDDRHAVAGYLRRHFSGALELVALGIDLFRTTLDEAFLLQSVLPLAREYLAFYRAYFVRTGPDGRLVLWPSQALETWQDTSDPLPEVAALRWVLGQLLALPAARLDPGEAADWRAWLNRLPELPTRWQGERFLLPAKVYDQYRNCENPELYAVFPFRFYGVGKPDLAVALATWRRRLTRQAGDPLVNGGWSQDPIQAAMLGLGMEAMDLVVHYATSCDPGSRFPAFWGPNFDWTPDQCHGGVLMLALQRMVMQAEHERIDLLPAWPSGWDVDFRLHAPDSRIVEGRFSKGSWDRLSGVDGVAVTRHPAQELPVRAASHTGGLQPDTALSSHLTHIGQDG